MSGGMKGPSKSGSISQQTTNPTQLMQQPFLQSGWNQAQFLRDTNPFSYYPGQSLASPNFWQPTGLNDLAAAGANSGANLLPQGNNLFSGLANGGASVQNSPAYSILQALAGGGGSQTGPQQGLAEIGAGNTLGQQGEGQSQAGLAQIGAGNTAAQQGVNGNIGYMNYLAALAGSPNQATDALSKTSRGDYLNSNPYLDGMFGSASNAVTRAYQTATAPQTDASFESAGRYGSGALGNARSQNQQDLGSTLNNLGANIYGTNYQNERNRQDAASSTLGSLVNQGLGIGLNGFNSAGNLGLANTGLQASALNQSGQLGLAGAGLQANALNQSGQLGLAGAGLQKSAADTLQSGFQAGNSNLAQTLAMFPSLLGAQGTPASQEIQAGTGMTGMAQQVIDDAMKRYYGNIQAPWQTNQNYLNQIGQPTNGSSQQQTPLLGPSPMSSLLGLAGGANSLFGSNGAFGSGGLFGGGSTPSFSGIAPADTSTFMDLTGQIAPGAEAASAGGKGASSALPFLAK